MEMEAKKTRHRRTAEERLEDLERKRQEVLARQREILAKIDAEKQRLTRSPTLRKVEMENQKRFERAVRKLAPDWDHRHFIVLIQEAVERGIDADAMAEKGEALLAEHGKSRRGRRPRNG
jgi:chromosome segregation ATPase